jgi:hypothetical protein
LGDSQLGATASVPGSWQYIPGAGAVLPAGHHALRGIFSPSDPGTYSPVEVSVLLEVTKAVLKVRAEDAARPQGQGNPPWSLVYSGFVNGDSPTTIVPPAASTLAQETSAAGSYAIVLSGGSAANYLLDKSHGVLLVTPNVFGTQDAMGPGYLAGQTISVRNTLSYLGAASALSWSVLLPPGWSYVSSDNTSATVTPVSGQQDLLEWKWSASTPSPLRFSYTVLVPSAQTGSAQLVGLAGITSGSRFESVATPDPLVLQLVTTHTADVDGNYRIGLLELSRVIELYNTRNAGLRSGAYGLAIAATEDGFEPAPSRIQTAVVALARYHTADTNRDGRIGLLELTRVIELYNYRSGGSRTGQYKPKSSTEDGFDPGP